MRRHFITGDSQVACGKNDHDLVAISKTNQVTCIKCRSSHLFKRAVNRATDLLLPEKVAGLLPKEFWEKYITELPGRNRLPRGFN
jgi:hypothetical protein